MLQLTFSEEQLRDYRADGFLCVAQLFDSEEIQIIRQTAKADRAIEEDVLERADGEGGTTRLQLWNTAGDDLYGRIARLPRIVRPMEQLLDGEVYYYHSKMNFKEPHTGGAWAWHQDYGYWYNNGCLYPLMASCLIAIDQATQQNGCLQVLAGSHLIGRIDHTKVGDQTGADPERVEQACAHHKLVHCELAAGDAIFFHCNLLHRSDQNTSPHPRWSYICCYNAARNNPYKESKHPRYHPLSVTGEDAIREWASLQVK